MQKILSSILVNVKQDLNGTQCGSRNRIRILTLADLHHCFKLNLKNYIHELESAVANLLF